MIVYIFYEYFATHTFVDKYNTNMLTFNARKVYNRDMKRYIMNKDEIQKFLDTH